MSLDQIRAIVKQRWETGAYGNAHFRMPQGVLDQMPWPEQPKNPLFAGAIGDLLSIPIVVDDGLPGGEWRLVDTFTKEILAVGTIGDSPEAQT